MTKLYADRDPRSLEPHYSAHVAAMTEEDLDRKSDIAAELAFRDAEIARLLAGEPKGHEVGLRTGDVDQHGELELVLDVDDHEGSVWISREFWEAVAEKAGWRPAAETDAELAAALAEIRTLAPGATELVELRRQVAKLERERADVDALLVAAEERLAEVGRERDEIAASHRDACVIVQEFFGAGHLARQAEAEFLKALDATVTPPGVE